VVGAGRAGGKRLAPFLPEIVDRLRSCGELGLDDATAAKLAAMSAATIDRRLAPDRAGLTLKGRSLTKPVSLLTSQIPIRTWADWDDAAPGFVEIDPGRPRRRRPPRRLLPDADRHRRRHRLDRATRGAQQGAALGVRG